MIALLTGINMRGVTLGAAIQTVFSVAKIGALAALVLLRAHALPPAGHRGRQLRQSSGARATGRSR